MRKLALATTALPLLLGLATAAQAGAKLTCTETAILECKSTKKGGFEVFVFTNHGGNASEDLEVGEDCTEALSLLTNLSDPADFFIQEVSTGTPDRTIYTLRADGEGLCPPD